MNKLIIFGINPVLAVLKNHPERLIKLKIQQERQDNKVGQIERLAKEHGIAIEKSSRADLDHLTETANHQGIVAFCLKPKVYSESDLKPLLEKCETPFVLILDGVQDPHNLGACFRSAEAARVDAIIVPKDKSASITPIVSKVASGAAEIVPFVQVTNLVRAIEELKELGLWIFGTDSAAEQTIFQTDLSGPLAIVLGSEGSGLRRLTREHCDKLIKIPMYGTIESLNVSVATGVCLFEVVRQRKM